ncbi:MAG: hypothetical protein PGN08_00815 [Sphingomonas taxi]
MTKSIEGIYAGYMTGSEGSGFSMFVFLDGVVTGIDPLGVKFDGSYCTNGGTFEIDIKVTVPSGGTVIQGASAGSSGIVHNVKTSIDLNAAENGFVRIDTPIGPVNLRLQKLRDIERS